MTTIFDKGGERLKIKAEFTKENRPRLGVHLSQKRKEELVAVSALLLITRVGFEREP